MFPGHNEVALLCWRCDGTTSPDSTLDVRGSINKIVYLRPNGSTDGTQINNAISALPSNGGIIYLLPGTWIITTVVEINKSGVKLRGYGSGDPANSPVVGDALTLLQWSPSASAKWNCGANQAIHN